MKHLLLVTLVTSAFASALRAEGVPILRLGMTPFLDLPLLHQESHALASYLGKSLGTQARVVLVPDYETMRHLLKQERLDLAWCTPGVYASTRGRVPYEVLCAISRGGSRAHQGLIVVRADSRFRTLHDLEGTVFSYVDRSSATGFILPNLLFEKEGIDPLAHFLDVKFALNHTAALDDLLAGRCDAAAVHDGARSSEGPIDPARLRVISVTGTSPPDPILVRASLPPETKSRLKDLLIRMPGQPGGPETLDILRSLDGIAGFIEAGESEYALDTETVTRSQTSMNMIYKIVPAALWKDATEKGVFAGAPVDLKDGYIHFSTATQVQETAAKHFAGQTDLLLVAIDPTGLGEKLRWEPSRGGALFPHLYADLPVRAASWVRPLPLGPDGKHVFPEL